MQPADPRLTIYAEAVAQRWAWPGLDRVVIDGKAVNAQTVIVEVLRAADSIHLLRDSAEPVEASTVDIEAAARLLASASPRYGPDGFGWEAVYASQANLMHARTQALLAAQGREREKDRINSAYDVLTREIARRSTASQA